MMKGSIRKLANVAISQLKKSSEIGTSASLFQCNVASLSSQAKPQKPREFPEKCDVCVIGGGAMGSSTAFWLKRHTEGKNLKVVVIERDNNYTTASTVLSLGGIRQQFSNGENIQLSLFGSEFIRNIQEYLGIEGEPSVDIQYHAGGYLFTATSEQGAKILRENHLEQCRHGSKVQLLSKEGVKKLYPCMNVDDIVLASVGVDNEGWFDPWCLLNGFKRKAISLGANYVTGEVVGFESAKEIQDVGPKKVQIRAENGEIRDLEFQHCVVAAGYESGKVSRMAGIGDGDGVLSVGVPVEPKKRYVYYIHAPELIKEKNLPLAIEPDGVYFRPDGSPGNFFAGRSPEDCDEPSCENLDVDYSFFDSDIWPTIARRVTAFENIKVKSAWGGYYDYNTFDQNGIIGTHPVFRNFHFATGFSGHGIQQSPAVGRAIMELILNGGFKTIDLKRFGFERVIKQERVLERNIV